MCLLWDAINLVVQVHARDRGQSALVLLWLLHGGYGSAMTALSGGASTGFLSHHVYLTPTVGVQGDGVPHFASVCEIGGTITEATCVFLRVPHVCSN